MERYRIAPYGDGYWVVQKKRFLLGWDRMEFRLRGQHSTWVRRWLFSSEKEARDAFDRRNEWDDMNADRKARERAHQSRQPIDLGVH